MKSLSCWMVTVASILTIPFATAHLAAQELTPEDKRLAVQGKLSSLREIRIEAPATIAEGQPYELRVTAPVPQSLRKALGLTSPSREPNEFIPISEWNGAVVLDKKLLPGLGVDGRHCLFGVFESTRTERKGWFLEWVYDGIGRQAGYYEISGVLGDQSARPAKIHVVHDTEERFYERAAEIFGLIRPAILVALGLLLFVVTDSIALFLYAFGWMVVAAGFGVWSNVADAAAALVIVSNQAGKRSFLDTLRSLPRQVRKLKDTISRKIDGSANQGGQGADGGPAPNMDSGAIKESQSLMDKLIERTKGVTEGSARRARWQLFASCVLALIAFVVLVLPLRRLLSEAATDNDAVFRRMMVAGIPYVAIFICLVLGARIFVQQYRLSLDDHRHFEESLRIREWHNLVLHGELDGLEKRKELLALFEAPPKPHPPTGNGTADPSTP